MEHASLTVCLYREVSPILLPNFFKIGFDGVAMVESGEIT